MYLTNKRKFEIVQPLGVDSTPALVRFEGMDFDAYLDRYEWESLLLGQELCDKGVNDDLLHRIQGFIENYGQDMREEGYSQGMDYFDTF